MKQSEAGRVTGKKMELLVAISSREIFSRFQLEWQYRLLETHKRGNEKSWSWRKKRIKKVSGESLLFPIYLRTPCMVDDFFCAFRGSTNVHLSC
jgi:hypothetical protein